MSIAQSHTITATADEIHLFCDVFFACYAVPYNEILSVRYLPIKRYCLALTPQQRKVTEATSTDSSVLQRNTLAKK